MVVDLLVLGVKMELEEWVVEAIMISTTSIPTSNPQILECVAMEVVVSLV